jgi:hypothetical protein
MRYRKSDLGQSSQRYAWQRAECVLARCNSLPDEITALRFVLVRHQMDAARTLLLLAGRSPAISASTSASRSCGVWNIPVELSASSKVELQSFLVPRKRGDDLQKRYRGKSTAEVLTWAVAIRIQKLQPLVDCAGGCGKQNTSTQTIKRPRRSVTPARPQTLRSVG